MMDPFSDLFDLVTLCAGLGLIAWLGWRETVRRKTPADRSLPATDHGREGRPSGTTPAPWRKPVLAGRRGGVPKLL